MKKIFSKVFSFVKKCAKVVAGVVVATVLASGAYFVFNVPKEGYKSKNSHINKRTKSKKISYNRCMSNYKALEMTVRHFEHYKP